MEIGPEKAEALNKLEDTSIKVIQDYLDGRRAGGDDIVTARCMINAIKGNRQAHGAREALRFNMVSNITDDPAVLKRYIKATQPAIGKLLTAKK